MPLNVLQVRARTNVIRQMLAGDDPGSRKRRFAGIEPVDAFEDNDRVMDDRYPTDRRFAERHRPAVPVMDRPAPTVTICRDALEPQSQHGYRRHVHACKSSTFTTRVPLKSPVATPNHGGASP
jgi:hypothetical protein